MRKRDKHETPSAKNKASATMYNNRWRCCEDFMCCKRRRLSPSFLGQDSSSEFPEASESAGLHEVSEPRGISSGEVSDIYAGGGLGPRSAAVLSWGSGMSSSLDALLFVFVPIFARGTTELDDLVLRARGGVGGTVIKRDWLVRPSRELEEVASEDVFTSARRSIFHARGS